MAAQNFADHRGFGMAAGRDHQHIARLDLVKRIEHRAKIWRFAKCSDGAAE